MFGGFFTCIDHKRKRGRLACHLAQVETLESRSGWKICFRSLASGFSGAAIEAFPKDQRRVPHGKKEAF